MILDLEDAVATAEKPATRAAVAATLTRPRTGLLYVRVNAADTEFCCGDLVAVVRLGLDGIILPKVESPEPIFQRRMFMDPGLRWDDRFAVSSAPPRSRAWCPAAP